MTDESMTPEENVAQMLPVPISKITAKIGDGEGMIFSVPHDQSPFVVAQLFRAVGGDEVINPPRREVGRIIYAFSRPPQPEEFIAVVIG
jgi:hypothetical protein